LEARPPQLFYTPTSFYLGLADRDFWAMGLKSRWRPFYDACGLASRFAVTSGYEYGEISRTNVTYDLENLVPPVEFTQPDTNTNIFFVGLQQDWSREVNTYIRYRFIDNQWPMLGVTHREQLSLDAAINSNQPEHEDRIEIGGYWNPAANFLMNASFWIQNSSHHSEYVNFDQDNYPVVVSAWYAPDPCWSFTAGLATFSDWINQDVTLGREDGIDAGELTAWTAPWSYQGRANVLNLGATYLASPQVRLVGGFEFVRGWNYFDEPPAPPTANPDYGDLPTYSDVRVSTYRLTAGIDYELSRTFNTFFRYNMYDYDDIAMAWNAGTLHMFLGGVSAIF
jgi:hypothetical protein